MRYQIAELDGGRFHDCGIIHDGDTKIEVNYVRTDGDYFILETPELDPSLKRKFKAHIKTREVKEI